jgi:serine/threonine protein kinase/Tfp pilus assembly protein PilF
MNSRQRKSESRGGSGASRERLERALGEYIDRVVGGESIDAAEVLSSHPECAGEILRELETFEELREDGWGDAEAGERSNGALGAIGDYRLLRCLGRGGMGVVYEAWQSSMDRPVALKILPAGVAGDTRALSRFVREARTAGKLKHPNVVAVYGMGVEAETPYFAMELVDGETLARVIARMRSSGGEPRARTALETDDIRLAYCARVAAAFAEVADGLHHAHAQGVIHRDLKPSNLILDRQDRLRILDFGLARLEGQESLTLSGDLLGTPAYMSPEQARARQVPIDHRTDIYSLGVTLFETLTLKPPFRGKDYQDTLSQIISREPPPMRRRDERIPKDLETIVFKCLRKEPADRYSSAEALAQDLRRFARGEPIEARPQPGWERVARHAWRLKGRLAAAGIALIAVALLSLVLRQRAAESRREHEELARAEVVKLNIHHNIFGFRKAFDVAGLPVSAQREVEESVNRLRAAAFKLPRLPELRYHVARGLFILQRDADALKELDSALSSDRRFIPAAALRALILDLHGDVEGAERDRERAEEACDVDWKREWLAAWNAMHAGAWSDAVSTYERLVARGTRGREPYIGATIDALVGRGVARLEAKDFHRAAEDFGAAEILWPGNLNFTLLKGQAYYQFGDKDLAAEEFEKLLSGTERPDYATLWVSCLYTFMNDFDRAMEWVRRPIEGMTPDLEAERRIHEGYWLLYLGRFDEAGRAAEDAIALNSGSAWVWDAAGVLAKSLGRHERAEECFHEALKRDPRYDSSFAGIGHLRCAQGKVEEAIDWHRRALSLNPRSESAQVGLGDALTAQGRLTEGEAWIRRGAAVDPKNPHSKFSLAENLVAQGRLKAALAILEDSTRRFDGIADAFRLQGDILLRLGRNEDASAAYRKAAAHGRAPPSPGSALGRALETEGGLIEVLEASDEDRRWLLERLERGEAVRINCGGENHISPDGALWSRDRFFNGGIPSTPFRGDVHCTDDDVLYRSERAFPADGIGPGGYRVPLPRGSYLVALHFAEVWFGAAGLRSFDIFIEKQTVITNYEPFESGFAVAAVEDFTVSVEDDLLEIEFVPRVGNPMISAIEIQPVE